MTQVMGRYCKDMCLCTLRWKCDLFWLLIRDYGQMLCDAYFLCYDTLWHVLWYKGPTTFRKKTDSSIFTSSTKETQAGSQSTRWHPFLLYYDNGLRFRILTWHVLSQEDGTRNLPQCVETRTALNGTCPPCLQLCAHLHLCPASLAEHCIRNTSQTLTSPQCN
jgi:hypothetical protein